MPQVFEWQRRVEFCETDAAGIVHFSQLIIYMEQAEHALLRSVGLSVAVHATAHKDPLRKDYVAGSDLRWPRVNVECQFRSPARFEDVLIDFVTISKLGEKSITYSHRLVLGEEVVAEGSMTSVCCIQTASGMQSTPIPSFFQESLGRFLR
jgi:acyl-CoA thioester hydrolase